jgi:hypothetical protein
VYDVAQEDQPVGLVCPEQPQEILGVPFVRLPGTMQVCHDIDYVLLEVDDAVHQRFY